MSLSWSALYALGAFATAIHVLFSSKIIVRCGDRRINVIGVAAALSAAVWPLFLLVSIVEIAMGEEKIKKLLERWGKPPT